MLLVNGAREEETVELPPLVVTLPDELESPVPKAEPVALVAFADDAVVVASCGPFQFHVNGGREDVVLAGVKTCVEIDTLSVVVGGYAVFPSTLDGRGKLVILVKKLFFVADVFGSDVSDDVVASCLGRTAAWAEPKAKAVVLKRRMCIFAQRLLVGMDASLKMGKPWQRSWALLVHAWDAHTEG